MFISKAYAQMTESLDNMVLDTDPEMMPQMPSAGEAIFWNFAPLLVLGVLFYVLLIMPQQRRFKEHSKMLGALKKGDHVVTGGGLIGKIHEVSGNDELVIDLGNKITVTAVRSTVSIQNTPLLKGRPADKKSKAEPKKDEAPKKASPKKKTESAKKTTDKKKTPAKKTEKK